MPLFLIILLVIMILPIKFTGKLYFTFEYKKKISK